MNKKLIVSGIFVAICSISLAQASATDMLLAYTVGKAAAGLPSVSHKVQPKNSLCAYFHCECSWIRESRFSVACENGKPIADPNKYLEKRCKDFCGGKPKAMYWHNHGVCEHEAKCDITHT